MQKQRRHFISKVLAGLRIGLSQYNETLWQITLGAMPLGTIDFESGKLSPLAPSQLPA